MTSFNVICEMMEESAIVPLENHYDKKKIVLTEKQCAEYSVVINNVPENSIVIKADDAFKQPDTLFKGTKGECKRADYIIVSEKDDKKIILFIEMKKTKDQEKEIVQQFKGATCLLLYIKEIGKSFWDRADFLDKFQKRYVSIGHISVSKKKTRYEREEKVNDKPDKMLKITHPNELQFNRLVGGN